MATISALTEDFTGGSLGAAITAGNTNFTSIAGAGTSTFITDPFDASRRMMQMSTAAQSKFHDITFTAQTTLWFRFDFDIETPFSGTIGVLNVYDTGTAGAKILDIRQVNTARQIHIRNVDVLAWTSPTLAADTKYSCYVYVKTTGTKQIMCQVYNTATGALVGTSGLITSNTTAASVGYVSLGSMNSSTGVWRFGRLRGDTTTQPFDVTSLDTSVSDTASLSDSLAVARTVNRTDTLGLQDTVNALDTPESYWTYAKTVQIG